MDAKTFTTAEAAAKIGISRQTLFTWIENGQVAAPKPIKMGQRSIRFWTNGDIERVREFKGSLRPGPRSNKKK